MQVTELEHYGQDILTIQETDKPGLLTTLGLLGPGLQYAGGVIAALGLKGTRDLVSALKREIAAAEAMDWPELEAKGISRTDLSSIIKKIALAKVMAQMMGLEKAAALRRRFSGRISVRVFTRMFAPAETFAACGNGDFLPPFKQYYGAMMQAMKARGLEAAEVVVDEPNVFQQNVTYCAWAHVARRMGDPQYCYYSTCYGDEVFFPELCRRAGFRFHRTGTLATGAPVCDFHFERL